MLSGDAVNLFFAFAPWVIFVAIVVALYAAVRNQSVHHVAIGKTYACANCGRRGKHDHMVPVSDQGAVVWYCGRCSH